MLPEGCTIPLTGILFYLIVILVLAALIHWREKILKGKSDKFDALVGILDSL